MVTRKSVKADIRRVSDLLAFVEDHCRDKLFLFRGQPEDKPLLPKIARNLVPISRVLELEDFLLSEFKRRSRPHLTVVPNKNWDWLALAQHSGMATRLLDWSDNPLAALWFAVNESPPRRSPGVVWMFEVPTQDIVSAELKTDPRQGHRTKVFQPRHISPSIVAQGGWFTAHKFIEGENKFVPLEKNKTYKNFLTKFEIDADSFRQIEKQLDQFGINAASLFPGLIGLCKYLNWDAVSLHLKE